ncbi:hypothetical protein SPRG_17814, partial [Saprolegnia parasitica CBS 223.65]
MASTTVGKPVFSRPPSARSSTRAYVKCPNEDKVVCAIETKGDKPIYFRNQCFLDIGKCLNSGLSTLSARANPSRSRPTMPCGHPRDKADAAGGPDDVWDATDFYIDEDVSVDGEMPETANGTMTT